MRISNQTPSTGDWDGAAVTACDAMAEVGATTIDGSAPGGPARAESGRASDVAPEIEKYGAKLMRRSATPLTREVAPRASNAATGTRRNAIRTPGASMRRTPLSRQSHRFQAGADRGPRMVESSRSQRGSHQPGSRSHWEHRQLVRD